jgi:hypothetical protein
MPYFPNYEPDSVVEAYRRNTKDFACNPFAFAADYEKLR